MTNRPTHHLSRRQFLGMLTLLGTGGLLGLQFGITHNAEQWAYAGEHATQSDAHREQIESNYQAFQEQLPSLLASHRGKFALMRNRHIVEFFDTARDAYIAGQKLFSEDRLFSIQEVIETPVDLGFFSRALPQR